MTPPDSLWQTLREALGDEAVITDPATLLTYECDALMTDRAPPRALRCERCTPISRLQATHRAGAGAVPDKSRQSAPFGICPYRVTILVRSASLCR